MGRLLSKWTHLVTFVYPLHIHVDLLFIFEKDLYIYFSIDESNDLINGEKNSSFSFSLIRFFHYMSIH